MKDGYKLLFTLLFFHLWCFSANVITIANYTDQNVNVPPFTDLHITSANNALVRSTINLMAEDAWLFFDNMRPSSVLAQYQDCILINGSPLLDSQNAQVRVYAHGTVVIPHRQGFQPLEVFDQKGLTGNSQKYGTYTFYKDLGSFNNQIRSFKLKRGYMATFANNPDGTGYSRVFIADKEDMLVESLPDLLDASISFIRVFRWDWTTKKGWCGGNPELVDTLDCTWYYSWSADKVSTPNYQYVPIKQHAGWPSFDEINSKTNVCNLLSYNEPDHTDQANMTVEQAIAQWPELLKTGFRLGSPVPSNPGNGNGWLYRFLDKCDSLNYRVDYAVVHAYWGGKSPQSWYNDLKREYEKCGKRPLWITEWNNGANWTNEWWPDDAEAQKQKQLSDLKGILNVLDTCSFVERYSIYDWVNAVRINSNNDTKTVIRAMIWDGKVTPAGEYYKKNKSALAFNASNEVIPKWRMVQPVLKYVLSGNKVNLALDNPNEGLVASYIIERKINDGEFVRIAEVAADENSYVDDPGSGISGNIVYRTRLKNKDGSQDVVSNVVNYNVTLGNDQFQYGKSILSDPEWSYFKYCQDFTSSPVVVFGPPSSSSLPMSTRVKSVNGSSFMFHLDTWSYLANPAFKENVEIDYFVVLPGEYDLKGITAKAGSAKNIGRPWQQVNFSTPFNEIPAVFVTQTSSRNQFATAVRIRNVSKSGFEVCLQKELALQDQSAIISLENINYIALTPGEGTLGNQKIKVGLTAANTLGTIYAPAQIDFGSEFQNPLCFGFMQTTSDTIVSTLRYNSLTPFGVKFFRQRESSKTGSPSAGAKEQGAWMVISQEKGSSGIADTGADDNGYILYPNPATETLFIKNNPSRQPLFVEVFEVSGQKVLTENAADQISVSKLKPGVYYVRINQHKVYKIVKR